MDRRQTDAWKDSIENRLDNIEHTLGEIHEVFQAVQGGLKMIEFLGRIGKALLPIMIFCGIAWTAVEQFFKGK
jgi:hypothetical protein